METSLLVLFPAGQPPGSHPCGDTRRHGQSIRAALPAATAGSGAGGGEWRLWRGNAGAGGRAACLEDLVVMRVVIDGHADVQAAVLKRPSDRALERQAAVPSRFGAPVLRLLAEDLPDQG